MTLGDSCIPVKSQKTIREEIQRMIADHKNNPYPEPNSEAKLWVITQLAQFIHDTNGSGSFRHMIYEYLNLPNYHDAYLAGGMVITNTLSEEAYKEWVSCESCETITDRKDMLFEPIQPAEEK